MALPFFIEVTMDINIKDLRARSGLSQNKFALLLGVSVASLRRWESGDTSPSALALKRIEEINRLSNSELLDISSHVIVPEEKYSPKEFITAFTWRGKEHKAQWEPFVINGPKDQRAFFEKLIDLQQRSNVNLSKEDYFRRLSLLQSVEGVETSQYQMENPKQNAKSWSSDYGTHGFHRYVGRFPSHLIRALINYYGATSKDVVLDPFCGSGTTLVEARMLGVKATGIEISPLSAMISRVKSQFPREGLKISEVISQLSDFYSERWDTFVHGRCVTNISYDEILSRDGNRIESFSNVEKWFTQEALLGTSIIVEYILQQDGYVRDFITIALSSKMRSIGNVDVDVVRAEYRKEPRKDVDVLKLVTRQIQKMASSVNTSIHACQKELLAEETIKVINGSVLDTDIPNGSISYIITSPPYGVESLSYLRTHLLSFRALEPVLGIDPYNFGEGIIGSEYLDDIMPDINSFAIANASQTYRKYFHYLLENAETVMDKKRVMMMMRFFEDMYLVVKRFSVWLKKDGKVAFIIGNKKIGDSIIPTDIIIKEIFENFCFELEESIAHKLKTNNSNSQVPWQDRIIENEFIMLFKRVN
jgi:tRNA G10  N-methylase Trm11/DNA-binding XRE family transcriptional regulator